MTEFDELFDKVSSLKSDYKDKEVFNLLHSVGFRNQEVMHSKFIATMLDPKGSHSKGDQFLKLLLTQIGVSDFETDNTIVCLEKRAEKRWIDITVENSQKILIIENKIWAKDQSRQLEDYYNSCIKTGKKVEVIYLTPYGHSPSFDSLGETLCNKSEVVKCISYEKAIIPWIDRCEEISDGRLKHSLKMYNEVLRVLINRDKYMNEIFEYLINDKEKLKLAIDINSALQERNYITEFSLPKTIEFLKQCIEDTGEEVNPYPDGINMLNIADDGSELEGWYIVFDENVVLAQNRNNEKQIYVLNPKDINDKRLQSIILEAKDSADGWIYEILQEMKMLSIINTLP